MIEATFNEPIMDIARDVAAEFQPPKLPDGSRNPAFGEILFGGVDVITAAEKIVKDMEALNG